MAKMIKVTLTKSTIGASHKQRKVVEALRTKKDAPVSRARRLLRQTWGAIDKVDASFDCRRSYRIGGAYR